MSDDIVVEVKDLDAGYLPGINIINSANLVARKGELIGIIGPNGAGKSTLLKSIFGLVKVRGGDITVNASQYAYAIYRHWGFLPDGERQHIDGLIIIPMRWRPGRSTTGDSDFLPDVPPA